MKNPQELAITIKEISKYKNIKIRQMLNDCNLSVNTLSSMQSGGYYPRLEAITKIADYLDCSVDYLLGRTDNPQEEIGTKKAPAATAATKYPIITSMLDELNHRGLDEAEKHTRYLTTQEEYTKNIIPSPTSRPESSQSLYHIARENNIAAFGGDSNFYTPEHLQKIREESETEKK